MDVFTTRFGTLSVDSQDELIFESGLIGLEHCRRWVVLSDTKNPTLGWLQSLDEGHIALGVVSPRRFVPDYQLRIDRAELQFLELTTTRDAEVVVIASRQAQGQQVGGQAGGQAGGLTLNLRAPLVINVERRRGCQVIAKDDLPVQFPLSLPSLPLKRTA
ncbi:MAG: flagellar assembly protein FliW [Planctomycetes bacterium]|nr:flagellar assembly protein FliW [Planctomycetota bacterium]